MTECYTYVYREPRLDSSCRALGLLGAEPRDASFAHTKSQSQEGFSFVSLAIRRFSSPLFAARTLMSLPCIWQPGLCLYTRTDVIQLGHSTDTPWLDFLGLLVSWYTEISPKFYSIPSLVIDCTNYQYLPCVDQSHDNLVLSHVALPTVSPSVISTGITR